MGLMSNVNQAFLQGLCYNKAVGAFDNTDNRQFNLAKEAFFSYLISDQHPECVAGQLPD